MRPPTFKEKQRACTLEIDGRKGCFLIIDMFGSENIVIPGRGLPLHTDGGLTWDLLVDETLILPAVEVVWCFLDEMQPTGTSPRHFVAAIEFEEAPSARGKPSNPNRRRLEPTGVWEACERFMIERAIGSSSNGGRSRGL
ncbi:hypothetical protein MASR1M60_13300 [Rhodocyclaceae bacterium]